MVEFESDTGVILTTWYLALKFLSDWGWIIIGCFLLLFVIWSYLEPIWYDFINGNGKDVLDSLKNCSLSQLKSSLSGRDKVEKLMSDQDKARAKMQEAYDQKLKEKKEQQQTQAENPFAPLADNKNNTAATQKKPAKKKPTAAEISALLGQNSGMNAPRYRPGADRYRGSRGG